MIKKQGKRVLILLIVFVLTILLCTDKVNSGTISGIQSAVSSWYKPGDIFDCSITTDCVPTGGPNSIQGGSIALAVLKDEDVNTKFFNNYSISDNAAENMTQDDFLDLMDCVYYEASSSLTSSKYNYWESFYEYQSNGTVTGLINTSELTKGKYDVFIFLIAEVGGKYDYRLAAYAGTVYIKDVYSGSTKVNTLYFDAATVTIGPGLPSTNPSYFDGYFDNSSCTESNRLTLRNGTLISSNVERFKNATNIYTKYVSTSNGYLSVKKAEHKDYTIGGEEASVFVTTENCYVGSGVYELPITANNSYPTISTNGYNFDCYRNEGYEFKGLYTATTEIKLCYSEGQYYQKEVITSYGTQCYDASLNPVGTVSGYGSVVLYPKYELMHYYVDFNNNEGTGTMTSQEMVIGSNNSAKLTKNTFTKTGHNFLGWSTNASATAATYIDEQEVSNLCANKNDRITLYAIWEGKNHTVTIVYNNGDPNSVYNVKYGDELPEITTPTKIGYKFNGWDKTIPSVMGDEDLTITATWLPYKTISVYTQDSISGKVLVKSNQFYQGETIPESFFQNIGKEGFQVDSISSTLPSVMPNDDTEIIYVLKKECHIYYYTDSQLYETLDILEGTQLTSGLVEIPTKYGHVFDGWDVEFPTNMPNTDITTNATWVKGKFTLSFSVTGLIISPKILEYGEAVPSIGTIIVPGYVFKGWDKDYPETMPGENVTLTAILEAKTCVVTVKLNNGEADLVYNVGINMAKPTLTEPVREHYSFAGWSEELPDIITEDITIEATWENVKYTIKFKDASNGSDITAKYIYGETIIVPECSKTNYTFVGWSATIPSTMPSHDVEITALWVAKKFKITFDTDGGNTINEIELAYKSEIKLPANPTKEGYTFVSWDKSVPKIITADISLKAIWKINTYKLTYYFDNEIYKEYELDYNSEIQTEVSPTKKGYTFVSWDQDVPQTMPANDVTLHSVFKKIVYTVTFFNYEGEVLEIQKIEYGNTINDVEAPVKDNYSFKYWLTDLDDKTSNFDVNTPIENNISLYPLYEELQKTNKVSQEEDNNIIEVYSQDGLYVDTTLVVRIIDNTDLEDPEKINTFLIDYSRYMGEDSILGCVYNLKLFRKNNEIKPGNLDVVLPLTDSLITKTKLIVYHVLDEETYEIIEDFIIEDGKLKLHVDDLQEFAIFYYRSEQEVPEEKDYSLYFIIGGVSLTIILGGSIVLIAKARRKKRIKEAFDW